jgi:lipid A 3-O-deacylase
MIFPFSLTRPKRTVRTIRTGTLSVTMMLAALTIAFTAGAATPADTPVAIATSTSTGDSRGYRGCAKEPGMQAIRAYPGVYNFYYENDLFTGSDNNYTNGIKLSWVSSNLQDYVSDPCLPVWVRRLNRLSEVLKPGGYDSRNMVVTLGQAMYTPTDLHRRDLIKNDRPYAGWLYLGLAYNARNTRQMDTTEIDIGVVGPASLARQSQNFVHDLRGFERFEGWDNQLHNELGVQIVRERKNKLFVSRNQNGPQFDVISHYGASLGNVKTYLNGGIELRFGHLPDDFGTASIRPGADSNAPLEENQSRRLNSSGVHVFLALDGRAVARDIFLDGNTFGSSHSVAKKHLVGDAALGVSWQWEGGKVSYAQYLRSKEFYGQDSSHGYGSLTLSLEY